MNIYKLRKVTIINIVCYLVLFYLILFFEVKPLCDYSDILGLISQIFLIPLFYLCIKNTEEPKKITWVLFAISASLYFLGELVYFIEFHLLGKEPVIPSGCDFFYILELFICIWALFCYIRNFGSINIMNFSIDMFLTMLSASGILYILVFEPILKDKSLAVVNIVIGLLYPISSIALLFGIFFLFFNSSVHRFFRLSLLYISLAFILMCVCEFVNLFSNVYNYNIYNYHSNILTEPLWPLPYFFISLAGLYDLDIINKEKDSNSIVLSRYMRILKRSSFLENLRLIIPYIFSFCLLIFVAFRYNLFNFIYIWCVIIIFLFSLRQIFIIYKNRVLLHHIQVNEHQLNIQNIKLQQLNRKIMRDSQIDFLTKLFNRRYIDEIFKVLTPSQDATLTLGVILIDVDFFKKINDSYGHQIGDQVLQLIAGIIADSIRKEDYGGRFGGDEFIVVLPSADLQLVEEVAKTLHDRVKNHEILQQWQVSLSVGGTSCQVTKETYQVSKVLKLADKALYEAKESGRDCYKLVAC